MRNNTNPKRITPGQFAMLPGTARGAMTLKVSYYFTGIVCKAGHLSPRYTSSGNCMECVSNRAHSLSTTMQTERSHNNLLRAIESCKSGNTTYIPEKACKHGHFLRYIGTNNCVECCQLNQAKRKLTNYSKNNYFKKTHGITAEQYEKLCSDQNFACGVCKRTDQNLHLDHCHSSGKIRGILCGPCNQALGMIKDNPEILRKLAEYIEAHA